MRLGILQGRAIQAIALVGALALSGGNPPVAEEGATAEGRPVATFPTFLQDFGEVGRGDKLHHTFVVRNDGDAVLEILSVQPT